MNKNKYIKIARVKYLIYFSFIIFLLLLLWVVNKSVVSLNILPTNALVTIDNKPIYTVRGRASKLLPPGKHQIRVEADGYIGYSGTQNFRRLLSTNIKVNLAELSEPKMIGQNIHFITKGNTDNELFYLDSANKAIFKTIVENNDGSINLKTEQLTNNNLEGISDIVWAPNKDLALFKKADGYYLFDFHKYDFVNQTQTLWGKDIGSAAWAPDNSKIAYYFAPQGGERSLMFTNILNTESTRVVNLKDYSIENPILKWSKDSRWLLVIPRSKEYGNNKIYAFDSYTRTMKQLTDNGSQIDASFSPDGSKILFSTYSKDSSSNINSALSIMDIDGNNTQSIEKRTTIQKSDWSESSSSIILSLKDELLNLDYIEQISLNTKKPDGFLIRIPGISSVDNIYYLNNKTIGFVSNNTLYALGF